ncbi:MAG: class I SAM-dependent methyltransferase [Desulfurococcales archaeon]|nr:class I SAM-dependent methyltransferase [Desulfurococcales archaeon]
MSTAGIFDECYEKYDSWYTKNIIIALNEAGAIKSALNYPYQPCLEIGVGSGWFASKLKCLTGVDPSYNMLLKARKRGIEVIQGVGESLPFKSRVFKTVLIVVTICFVDKPILVLREAGRIVSSDGRIIVCIIPRNSPWGDYYTELASQGHVFYSVARFYTRGELIDTASSLGFELEDCLGTLTFHPKEPPYIEEPRKCSGKEGFICLKFKPYSPQSSLFY